MWHLSIVLNTHKFCKLYCFIGNEFFYTFCPNGQSNLDLQISLINLKTIIIEKFISISSQLIFQNSSWKPIQDIVFNNSNVTKFIPHEEYMHVYCKSPR